MALVLVSACTKKDSLYIDTSKDGPAPAEPNAQKAAEPAPKGAEAPPPAAQPAPKR